MEGQRELPGLRDRLDELQDQTLAIITSFAGLVGYVWLVVNLWLIPGRQVPYQTWIGSGILCGSVCISLALKRRRLRVATNVLVWGVVLATACAAIAFSSPAIPYLFVVPVIFSSVLVGQSAHLLIAAIACFFIMIVNPGHAGPPWPSNEVPLPIMMGALVKRAVSVNAVLPVFIIALTAVSSVLFVRSLNTALAWFCHEYERARRNAEIARDGQAELRRTLKALDGATHRLERANHMLAGARNQAEEARRLKQQFAQAVSHELRTPLNLIIGFSELMTDSPEYYGGSLLPTYLRDLNIVHRNARHLQTLVDDVLDLARIEAAQMSIVPEVIEPATLVQDAVNTVRSLIESRGLDLRTEFQADLPPLWVDPVRIRQVLINLLNNAGRFTERGHVTISVQRTGDEVTFAVADTGVGIAVEDIHSIFEEFQQAERTGQLYRGGFGLGLVICQRFIELHGGRIWVESVVGQGSTFYFCLPLARARVDSALQASRAEPCPTPRGPGRDDPVLLVVSRNTSAAALLSRYVQRCHKVIVQDVEQVRRAVLQQLPQVIVLDTACEDVSLGGLTKLVQEWGAQQTVFLSSHFAGAIRQGQQPAVNGYLTKPLSRRTLWDTLRRFGEGVDRVLVIDDDKDFVSLIGRFLESSPVRRYQVTSAYSGEEGLALMNLHQPDLVLVDLMLPETHGFEIIERIRSNPTWEHIPVLIVSAQDEMQDYEPLADGILITQSKGFMPGEVVHWVQSAVDRTLTAPLGAPAPREAHVQ